MRSAVALGTTAAAGGVGLLLPETSLAAVPAPTIYSTSQWGARAPNSAVSVLNYRPS
jgi:hypothetical protein